MVESVGNVRKAAPSVSPEDSSIGNTQIINNSASVKSPGVPTSHSALVNAPKRVRGNTPTPAAIEEKRFPLMRLQQSHPILTPHVVSYLDLDEAKALRLTNKAFKTPGATRFTRFEVDDATKIGDMAELLVDAKNICSILIYDPDHFGDNELAQLVAMLPDSGAHITQLNLSRCKNITDAGLQHLSNLTALQDLDLAGCENITDAGLQHLSNLTALEELDLFECDNITGAGFLALNNLTALKWLNLNSCENITDEGLQHLSNLTALEALYLFPCYNITDAGLLALKNLTALRSLNLNSCDITDAGLEHLSNLTALEKLDLNGCENITDAGLLALNNLTALRSINLYLTDITNAGLQHLSNLTALESLDLSMCDNITDAGLQHLTNLTALKTLHLNGTQVSANYLTQLRSRGIGDYRPLGLHF
jgi:hypothetical protein